MYALFKLYKNATDTTDFHNNSNADKTTNSQYNYIGKQNRHGNPITIKNNNSYISGIIYLLFLYDMVS